VYYLDGEMTIKKDGSFDPEETHVIVHVAILELQAHYLWMTDESNATAQRVCV
jgi:hypothetical protein